MKEQGVRGVASTYGDAALPHAPLPVDLMADDAADGDEGDDLLESAVAASNATRGQDGYAGNSTLRAGLSAGDRDLLRELLTELVECTRILEVAREV